MNKHLMNIIKEYIKYDRIYENELIRKTGLFFTLQLHILSKLYRCGKIQILFDIQDWFP